MEIFDYLESEDKKENKGKLKYLALKYVESELYFWWETIRLKCIKYQELLFNFLRPNYNHPKGVPKVIKWTI